MTLTKSPMRCSKRHNRLCTRYTGSMRLYLLITLLTLLILPEIVSAQSLASSFGSTAAFSISASPQYPAPYSNATLSFLSTSLDLANATLIVSENGKNIYRGAVQPLTIALGRAGSVTNVTATLSAGGTSSSQKISLQPQDVAIVAEPVSSAPPLYPGKPLAPLEGTVRVVAVANFQSASGKLLDSSALSYVWTVDGAQIVNSSGIGKESILVASPLQYRARTVSVSVMSQDGSLVGGASFSFSPQEPSLRIYENDPLLGIRYDHALSSEYAITGAESSLYAAPFSFPITSGAPFLQWFLNGTTAQTGNSITLRPTGSGQGNALLSLTASNGSYTTATASLSLSFGAKPGTNFFGL